MATPPQNPEEDINTTDRDEMWCLYCNSQSLAPAKDKLSRYDFDSKEQKLVYATKCSNPNCEAYDEPELQQEYVKLQLPTQDETTPLDTIKKVLGVGAVVIIGYFLLTTFILTGPSTVALSGEVITPTEQPVQQSSIVVNGKSYSLSGNSTVKLQSGITTVYAHPSQSQTKYGATPPIKLKISKNSIKALNNSEYVITKGNSIRFILPKTKRIQKSHTTISPNATITYANGWNAKLGTNITLIGGGEKEVVSKQLIVKSWSQKQEYTLIGEPKQTSATVYAPKTAKRFNITKSYTGGTQKFTVYGKHAPRGGVITFPNGIGTQRNTKTAVVSDGSTMKFTVDSRAPAEAKLRLYGGSGSKVKHERGLYTGETDPTVTIDKETAPATAQVALTGVIKKEQVTKTGTTNTKIPLNLSGNINARDIEITFNGGKIDREPIDSATVSASGKNGIVLHKEEIFTANKKGEYIIETNVKVEQSDAYVSGGYQIENGPREQLDGRTTVSLDAGQTVYVWVRAEPEVDVSGNEEFEDGNSPVEIQSYSVSKTDVSTGEDVSMEITLYNPTSSGAKITITPVKDDSKLYSLSKKVPANSQRTVTVSDIQFSSSGLHTLSVNGKEATIITVGDVGTRTYGVGETVGKAYDASEKGTVKVDVDGDSSYDCSVSASGGTCKIRSLSQERDSIDVKTIEVSDVKYTLSYTARTGAKGITVDVGNDGSVELSHGELLRDGETIETTVTLPAGKTPVAISVTNGGPAKYDISWRKSGVVDHPTVKLDGKTVVNVDESYRGSRTFDLGTISSGQHTLTFGAASGNYTAKLVWIERNVDAYPDIFVNGNLACSASEIATSQNRVCDISDVIKQGENTVSMTKEANGKTYRVSYKGISTANKITLTVNGDERTITRTSSGTWSKTVQIDGLKKGSNKIVVNSGRVQFVPTRAKATINYESVRYGPQNPVVIVKHNGVTHKKKVPSSELNENNVLAGSHTVEVPEKWFGTGENTVIVKTSNNQPVTVQIQTFVVNGSVAFEK